MEYEEIEKLSLEESKRQTKERTRTRTKYDTTIYVDEKKMLWDGLYNEKIKNI